MKVSLKTMGQIVTGNTPSKSNPEYWHSDDISFVKPDILPDNKVADVWKTKECISEAARSKSRIVGENAIFVTCIGSIGKIGIATKGEFAFNQQINAIIPNSKVFPKYLAYALLNAKTRLTVMANAPVVPIINKSQFGDFQIDISENYEEQKRIAVILDSIESIITQQNQALYLLDKLVKSRFVEMFGDPVSNSMGLPTEPMTAVCAIIDGDRGKNYPKQDEFSDTGYCLFLNAKNVTTSGFSFENCMFITKEKDTALRNGKLERGDVVLTTRGTLGNLAFYDDSVSFENVRINSGMVILRMKKCVMTEVFFIEQFKLQLQSIKGKIASGSAQPQLPISTMNKIRILLAPIELQEQFAAFVAEVDKSKLAVKQSLEKLETLKKSLMQQYFG